MSPVLLNNGTKPLIVCINSEGSQTTNSRVVSNESFCMLMTINAFLVSNWGILRALLWPNNDEKIDAILRKNGALEDMNASAHRYCKVEGEKDESDSQRSKSIEIYPMRTQVIKCNEIV